MPASALSWTPASPGDSAALLVLMRDFYAEEHLDYDEDRASRAIRELLAAPALGAILVLREGPEARGYFIATFGYSVEFGGRYALLDELYLDPAIRGRGEGTRALAEFETWAAGQEVTVTRLEVTGHNGKARAIYVKRGYVDDQRSIFAKWNVRKGPDA